MRTQYGGPEEPEAASVMSGILGFVRKFARIVGRSPVENGRFVRRSSSFRQEFWEFGSGSNRTVEANHIRRHVR